MKAGRTIWYIICAAVFFTLCVHTAEAGYYSNGLQAGNYQYVVLDEESVCHSCFFILMLTHENLFFLAVGEKIVLLGEKDLDKLNGKQKDEESQSSWLKYVPFVNKKKKEESPKQNLFIVPEKFNRKKPVYLSEENINQYKFQGCCHPIPGDDALGYINTKNQIEIHKRACPVAAKLKSSFGNRILDIKWDMHKILYFDATIRLGGIDRVGLLNEITQIVSSQMNVNIHKILITCDDGIFDGSIDLRVHDREDVKQIMQNLKKIADLKEISEIM